MRIGCLWLSWLFDDSYWEFIFFAGRFIFEREGKGFGLVGVVFILNFVIWLRIYMWDGVNKKVKMLEICISRVCFI